jgi:hypothetical protein
MHGLLPWQSSTRKLTKKLLNIRMAITPSTLCKGLPDEFAVFLNYVRSLEFKQKQDYQYLRGLFPCLCKSVNDGLLLTFEEPHQVPPKRKDQAPVPSTTRR